MTPAELRERAAERRRVGWELSDAMTPAEMERIADAMQLLIEDRARFPDRPDMVGRMIAASFGNLRSAKEQSESYARDAIHHRDRLVRLLQETVPALELAHSMKRGGPAKSNALALLNRVRAATSDNPEPHR